MARPRRDPPEHLRAPVRAFADVAARLERAKRELLRAIPGARSAGVPLAEALLAYREGLEEAAARMAEWRAPEIEAEWIACATGIESARAAEEAVRLRGGVFPHDALLFTLQDLIAPLGPFEDAARRFRQLRSG